MASRSLLNIRWYLAVLRAVICARLCSTDQANGIIPNPVFHVKYTGFDI